MDPLSVQAIASSRILNLRQMALSDAIVSVGANPTPESVSAMNQAQVQYTFSTAAMKKVEEVIVNEGAQLAQMMGAGQGLNILG